MHCINNMVAILDYFFANRFFCFILLIYYHWGETSVRVSWDLSVLFLTSAWESTGIFYLMYQIDHQIEMVWVSFPRMKLRGTNAMTIHYSKKIMRDWSLENSDIIRKQALEGDKIGIESHRIVVWPWASYLMSLNLNFRNCDMGVMMVLSSCCYFEATIWEHR